MLIPHSESRIINLKVTVLALVVMAVVGFGLVSAFFYATTLYSSRTRMVGERSAQLDEVEAGLQRVQQSVTGLRGGASTFQSTLTPSFQQFGLSIGDDGPALNSAGGDFAELESLREISDEQLVENLYLSTVSGMLDEVIEPLEQLASRIEQERDFLTNLPVLWPLGGGRGRVRRSWGPSIDPISGDFTMNQGLVLWDVAGAPVVTSAHGRVTRVEFDPDHYGWYVDIEHGFGFKTRYSHLQQVRVRSGDSVSQGQTIATLGSTGRVVEPQLGFEIWLGTENVDPDAFLTIRSALGEFADGEIPADLTGR